MRMAARGNAAMTERRLGAVGALGRMIVQLQGARSAREAAVAAAVAVAATAAAAAAAVATVPTARNGAVSSKSHALMRQSQEMVHIMAMSLQQLPCAGQCQSGQHLKTGLVRPPSAGAPAALPAAATATHQQSTRGESLQMGLRTRISDTCKMPPRALQLRCGMHDTTVTMLQMRATMNSGKMC